MTRDQLVQDAVNGINDALWQRLMEIKGFPAQGLDLETAREAASTLPDEDIKMYLPAGTEHLTDR